MIYLLSSLDGNDIIEVEDWKEIAARPNFSSDVNLKDKHLYKIIGSYKLKDKRTCGITSCHTPHNKGFIVVTDDGIETNIGNDCGFKYFNVKFNELTQEFLRGLTREQRKIALDKAIARIDEWRLKADDLKNGDKNIDWAIKLIDNIKNPLVIGFFASIELKKMANMPTNVVTVPVKDSEKESDIQNIFGKTYTEGGSTFTEKPIGTISHIDCLTSQYDLRRIFYFSVTKVLKELSSVKYAQMSSPALSVLLRKVDGIDFNLNLASERLKIARVFLCKENLKPMYEKMKQMDIVSRADLKRFEAFINSIQ